MTRSLKTGSFESGQGDAAGRHSPKTVRPGRKRELVAETCDEWNVSIRRACRVLEFDTSTYHYSPAAAIRPASKLGSRTSAPHGSATDTGACTSRNAHARGLGHQHQANLSNLQGLGPAAQERDAEAACEGEAAGRPGGSRRPERRLAMDFVHDQLATGKKICVLTVVDTFCRYVPVLDPRFSYRAEDVVRALEQVCPKIGYPKTIRVDQGSEFVSRDLDYGPTRKA